MPKILSNEVAWKCHNNGFDFTKEKKKEKTGRKKKAAESTKGGKRKCNEDMDDESTEECDSPSNSDLNMNSDGKVEVAQKGKKGGKREKGTEESVQV